MSMQNHFELFHLPAQFAIEPAVLERAYHDVQSQVHPDRFSTASDAEKRVAMQWATRANEAYQTLKNPLKRAAYLCELHGVDLKIESNTAMPISFLTQQMELREALDEARGVGDLAALEVLDGELRTTRKMEVAQIANALDAGDYAAAALGVRQLMFVEKFGEEVVAMFELLEQDPD